MTMKKNTNRLPLWKNPRIRYGSVSTAIVCLMLAALVGMNMVMDTLEKKNGWRVDYSFNSLTTQSEKTLQILEQLPHPVHIYALFSKGQEDAPLMELLDRYAAASPLVTWEQTDVNVNPGLLTRFRGDTSEEVITNDCLIVHCEATGRWEVLSPVDFISLSLNYEQGVYEIAGLKYESEITSAIDHVTRAEIPRIMVLQGHHELDEGGTAVWAELMQNNHFEVVYFTFGGGESPLKEGDLLAILSPQRDLTDTEMAHISDFARKGGSILFTCDYADPVEDMPNYASLLRSYGFVPGKGMVIASQDEPGSYYSDVRTALIPTMNATDVTRDLVENGADTLLLAGTRGFAMPEETDRSLSVAAVLTSGYKAYMRDMQSGNDDLEQSGEDELGPFALALQAQRMTEDGYVSRAFVLGCSTVLTASQIHAMTDSQEFILRMTEYLLDTEPADLNIMAKAALRPQLSVESVTLGSVLLAALPLMVAAAALMVLWPRKNR